MILADISMPELDGFEFCRRVRNHPMLSRLPLLFISGSDKYKERYRALQIGADDFLSKSMPIRELLMVPSRLPSTNCIPARRAASMNSTFGSPG